MLARSSKPMSTTIPTDELDDYWTDERIAEFAKAYTEHYENWHPDREERLRRARSNDTPPDIETDLGFRAPRTLLRVVAGLSKLLDLNGRPHERLMIGPLDYLVSFRFGEVADEFTRLVRQEPNFRELLGGICVSGIELPGEVSRHLGSYTPPSRNHKSR